MLLYFALAELLGGLAGITGAYFAGLFHRMADTRHHAERVISPFVSAVLLPLFLCSIGLQVDIKLLHFSEWSIVLLLLVIAIISKLLACYIATNLSNLWGRRKGITWSKLEGFIFGSSMVARGEVGLVVATILHGASLNGVRLISSQQYVIAVIVIVLTTIAAPIMLSFGFSYQEAKRPVTAPVSLNLGLFDVIGTTHLFNIILGRIEQTTGDKSTVRFSEGRRIVTVPEYDVKVIHCPDVGIIFEGNKEHINEILNMVKDDVLQELERCTVTPP